MSESVQNLPIAVIDSGVGGISVLRELRRLMPRERFLYFGDSANAPYGTKSREEVLSITRRNLETLRARGIKALVIACNTATSAAAKALRAENPDLPIIGIEPAVKPAALLCDRPRVLVMATPLTLREEKFLSLVARFADRADVHPLPCAGLVELIEEGHLDDAPLDAYLDALFAPIAHQHFDAVVLGCTHYPHVKAAIARHLSPSAVLLDGGEGTARETLRRLTEGGLLSDAPEGAVEIVNTGTDPRLAALCRTLLDR